MHANGGGGGGGANASNNNFNCSREHLCGASENEGKVMLKFMYAISWKKSTQKIVARKVLRKEDWHYMKDMLKDARKRAIVGIKITKSAKRKVMAPTERERTKTDTDGYKIC